MCIDKDYYNNTFHGEPVDDADFPSLCQRAEEIIRDMTMYRLDFSTLPVMPEQLQGCIRNAICAQIEYLDANGGADLDNGADLQSGGLGKFSYAKASGSGGQSVYSPRAQRLLLPTGFLSRGGGCL